MLHWLNYLSGVHGIGVIAGFALPMHSWLLFLLEFFVGSSGWLACEGHSWRRPHQCIDEKTVGGGGEPAWLS